MDILSITFSEIKHFALDSTGAGMAVIDKWFVGLVLLIAILPILTCWMRWASPLRWAAVWWAPGPP